MNIELRLDEESFKKALLSVASTEEGLKFIGHLIARNVGFGGSFQGNSRDVYNKGRVDSGYELLDALKEYGFDKFLELMKLEKAEKDKRENKNKKRREVDCDE